MSKSKKNIFVVFSVLLLAFFIYKLFNWGFAYAKDRLDISKSRTK